LATRPRKKSDESVSCFWKWVRAKVDLPLPEAPMSTTSATAGISRSRLFVVGGVIG
jgi:hypothetical protein